MSDMDSLCEREGERGELHDLIMMMMMMMMKRRRREEEGRRMMTQDFENVQ